MRARVHTDRHARNLAHLLLNVPLQGHSVSLRFRSTERCVFDREVSRTARHTTSHGILHRTAYYVAWYHARHGAYPARYDIPDTGILHSIVSRLAWHATRQGVAWHATRHGVSQSHAAW